MLGTAKVTMVYDKSSQQLQIASEDRGSGEQFPTLVFSEEAILELWQFCREILAMQGYGPPDRLGLRPTSTGEILLKN